MRAAPLVLSVGLAFTGSAHAWEWNNLTSGMTIQQAADALGRRGDSMRPMPALSTGNNQTYALNSAKGTYLSFCYGRLAGFAANPDGGFHVFLSMATEAQASYGPPRVEIGSSVLAEGLFSRIVLNWTMPEGVTYTVNFFMVANEPYTGNGISAGKCP